MFNRKKYSFGGGAAAAAATAAWAASDEEEEYTLAKTTTTTKRKGVEEAEEAAEEEEEDNTLIQQFFSRPRRAALQPITNNIRPSTSSSSLASSKRPGSFAPTRIKTRPKPDLSSDEDEDEEEERPRYSQTMSRLPLVAPVQSSSQQAAKRQRQLLELKQAEDAKQWALQQRQIRKQREEDKLREAFWMGQVLEGAKRSMDDRGSRGGKVVLRRDTVKETALQYERGKGAFQSSIVDHAGVNCGRFFLEPQGVKRTENNEANTLLYLFIARTGAEGLTVRVGNKYYEVFEGDCVLVPASTAYSVINPSKQVGASFTYLLVQDSASSTAASAEEGEEDALFKDEKQDDDVLNFNYRGTAATAAASAAGNGEAEAEE